MCKFLNGERPYPTLERSMDTAVQHKSIHPQHAERLAGDIKRALNQNAARLHLHQREDDATPPFRVRPGLCHQVVVITVRPWAAQLTTADHEAVVTNITGVVMETIQAYQGDSRPSCYCDVFIGDRHYAFHADQVGVITRQR